MDQNWPYGTNAALRGIPGKFAPSSGRPRNRRRGVAIALHASVIVVLLAGLGPGSDAQGARGTVQARARVLQRGSYEELERARSEIRQQHQLEIEQIRIRVKTPGRGDWAARDVDGGRLRVRVEGPLEQRRLTVETLAN